MRLIDRVAGWFDRDRMSRADRAVWAQARSLPDVGDRVARWLSGELRSQPAYCGPVDVDEATAPGMTDALIAANQAGIVTSNSQAGCDEGGNGWQQYAAVVGFVSAETYARLATAVADTPGVVLVDCDERGDDPVTFHAARPVTDFSRTIPARDLADDWVGYGVCHPDAVAELTAARQVVIRDTEFGRNDRVWSVLRSFQPREEGVSSWMC